MKTNVFWGLTHNNDKTKIKHTATCTVPNDTVTSVLKRVIIKNSIENGGCMKKGIANVIAGLTRNRVPERERAEAEGLIRRREGGGVGKPKCRYMRVSKTAHHPDTKMQGGTSKGRGKRKIAFTLAEVLITLGIIGIVAAMTLPTLIQNYKNHVVETRLQKFYSTINQAVKMAEVEYGDKKIWYEDISGALQQKEWFNKYLAPYIKIVKTDIQTVRGKEMLIVYFQDSSILVPFSSSTRDWLFYTSKKCFDQWGDYSEAYGVCSFPFNFAPRSNSSYWGCIYNKGFEPFSSGCPNSDDIKKICYKEKESPDSSVLQRTYCTKFLQLNGWKIPKDYPYNVWY